MESAKLRSLLAKNVLACQCALCAFKFTCLRALRTKLRTNVPCLLMCSPANVPCVLTCSHGNVSYVLRCSPASHVLFMPTCLRAYVL